MKDEIISYETANLAKEKGFNIVYNVAYCEQGILRTCNPDFYLVGYHNQGLATLAPTQSLLQKWLREVHNLHITISVFGLNYYYSISLINNKVDNCIQVKFDGAQEDKFFTTFEEALELGLQDALKLIEK